MPFFQLRSALGALFIVWVSVVSYALIGLIFEMVSSEEHLFAEYIESVTSELNNKLDTNEAVLAGFSAFLQAVERSDVEATTRYAALATAAYPHIYMMEVARKVPRADQHQLEKSMQKAWHPDFALKDFSLITRRSAVDTPRSTFTWPILFMYPALPEAREIYGLRLESVDYLAHSLALVRGKDKSVASPVFNLYEGGNAFILLQEVIRDSLNSSGTAPDFFGNTMVAMLIIKGQSLIPGRSDFADPRATRISARMDAEAGLDNSLFDLPASEATTLEKRLLPRFKRHVTVKNSSQPISLHFERQLRWRAFLTQSFLAKMFLLILALLFAPLLIVRHHRTLHQLALEHERTAYMATHDQLTDLPNRFLFADRFAQAFNGWKRNGSAFAIFIIDLDHFKEVNDTYGHKVGDQVLVATAQRMAEELRSGDSVARYGGDEFAVLLGNVFNAEEASKVAVKLHSILSMPIATSAGEVNIACSIGIAICPTHGETLDELSRAADEAMYRAKKGGRNGVSVFLVESS